MKSRKWKALIDVSKWFIVYLSIAVALLSYNAQRTKQLQIKGLTGQLTRSQTVLAEKQKQIEAYQDILLKYPDATANIVQDKYFNGHNYTIVVGKDFYDVTKEQYDSAEIGKPFDTSKLTKTE